MACRRSDPQEAFFVPRHACLRRAWLLGPTAKAGPERRGGHGITGPLEEVAGAELLRDGGSQLPVGARAFRIAATTLHLFLS